MNSASLQSLLMSLGVLSFLLLFGMFLRAKIALFRKLLIPASVIGGFIGLLLGPEILGTTSIKVMQEEWVSIWGLLPGILIVPIFAATPLGRFKKAEVKKGEKKQKAALITMISGIAGAAFGLQLILGVGVAMLLNKLIPTLNLYNNFGFELSQGFNGGHGSAGAVGNVLLDAGLPYWEVAQGVASTFATIGLIGGLLLGVFLINRASSKKETVFLRDSATLPTATSFGFTKDINSQGNLGRETTLSSTIETLTVHLGILLIACTLAYWVRGLAIKYDIIGLKSILVWVYALIIMFGINYLLNIFKLDWLIDTKVKSHITSLLTDIAITAAIASMPLKAVLVYILPIILISALGFIIVYYSTIKVYKYFMPNSFPFERAILSFGINTGVMMTGITLLKICDPNFESPALEDYSLCTTTRAVVDLFFNPIMFYLLVKGTSMQMFLFGVGYVVLHYIVVFIARNIYSRSLKLENKR